MKAAVIKEKGVISLQEVPIPQAGPEQVIIKTKYCGICGTDVRLFSEGLFPAGLTIGHEFCGTIHEIGSGVEGWAANDRVTVMPASACGSCRYCLRGQRHHCIRQKILGVNEGMHGAFAEYVKADVNMLYRLPDEVTDEEAANIEPFAVSLRAVRRSGIAIGDSVVVFGAGSIGLFVLQCARLAGARSVYVVEPGETRARAAALLEADKVFNPDEIDVAQEVAGLTGEGADVAFVCTAAPAVLQQAMDTVRRQGKVSVVGGGMTAQVIPEFMMWKEIEVKGSFAYLDEFALALELFRQGKAKVEGMISEVIPLEKVQQALGDLAQPTFQIKILVQPD